MNDIIQVAYPQDKYNIRFHLKKNMLTKPGKKASNKSMAYFTRLLIMNYTNIGFFNLSDCQFFLSLCWN